MRVRHVLTSVAFLEGLVSEELTPAELDYRDELYPLLLGLRATVAMSRRCRPLAVPGRATGPKSHAVVLMYHRVIESPRSIDCAYRRSSLPTNHGAEA